MAEELGVSSCAAFDGLKRIAKIKKLEKWVPHDLNDRQKLSRFEIWSFLLLRNQNDPLLDRIVTCDEKWILNDNSRRCFLKQPKITSDQSAMLCNVMLRSE